MKLIVLSSATSAPNEHEILSSLFEEGLENFHLHKPDLNKEEIKDFIQKIPFKYHNRIAVHSDFPKFHSLKELEDYKEKYEYAFLSPIFDSISKIGYKSKFSHRSGASLPNNQGFSQIKPELIPAIKGKNIIALGGVDENKIELTKKVGFTGVAVLGAIWNSKTPIETFLKIKAKCQKPGLVS